jgi:hypothetical protein
MSKHKSEKNGAVRPKGRPQLVAYLTDEEVAAFAAFCKQSSVIPGTPQSAVVRFVIRAGLQVLGFLKQERA